MKIHHHILAVCSAVLLTSVSAQAATLVFDDSAFTAGTYTVTQEVISGSATTSVVYLQNTGNPTPNAWGDMRVSFSSTSGGYVANLAFINNTASYDPSTEGALTNVTYDFGQRRAGGFFTIPTYRGALSQGGNIYIGTETVAGSTDATNFTSVLFDLNSTEWTLIDGTAGTPDFSATGGVMSFGLVASFNDNIASTNHISNINNLTVTAVPEPATAGLLVGGLAALLLARRRRR